MKIIQPETAKEAETRPAQATKPKQAAKPKPKPPKPSDMAGLTAREKAKKLAATKYGEGPDETSNTKTSEQNRRDTHIPFTFELTIEQTAKLIALSKASGLTKVATLRKLIEQAKIPR